MLYLAGSLLDNHRRKFLLDFDRFHPDKAEGPLYIRQYLPKTKRIENNYSTAWRSILGKTVGH